MKIYLDKMVCECKFLADEWIFFSKRSDLFFFCGIVLYVDALVTRFCNVHCVLFYYVVYLYAIWLMAI